MQEQLDKIGRQVNSIHEALIGNEYNKEGLIHRVKKMEDNAENDKKQKWMFAGGIVVLTFISKFWHKIVEIFS